MCKLQVFWAKYDSMDFQFQLTLEVMRGVIKAVTVDSVMSIFGFTVCLRLFFHLWIFGLKLSSIH